MEPTEIKHIIHAMLQLQGITRYYLLNKEEARAIEEMEDPFNLGVLEAVKHQYCVCLVHDSSWRIPTQSIVKKINGEIVFPPVAFPEVPAKNVVSSSPGMKVHEYLCKRVRVEGDEATLLIGFDL
ncbi:MAG: hypothetical protein IPJ89_04855 [Candidatus Iainarchaeum archaeon]|uniref:Uncharacterized protein n=1 Tax=Candidatus Iainarchaeum sp. TaxID=3101447 RepID=A0A7T9I1V6_9ARCH|nr:MAG: hypothetical protein IPJ89_04855 [Candidatus Diapherotrites archaeon]